MVSVSHKKTNIAHIKHIINIAFYGKIIQAGGSRRKVGAVVAVFNMEDIVRILGRMPKPLFLALVS
jgi:hypothetical protein